MPKDMKLGIFDSGLGGIMIYRAIRDALPDIDMVYLGDTLHVPYGNRSEDAIYQYTQAAMEYLFTQQDCQIIITACNTASANALRKLQQDYLPKAYPDRRILGVIVPTIEHALEAGHKRIGLIGTNYTINCKIYEEELGKINPDIQIISKNTPLLVPLIENDGMQWIQSVLEHYIEPLNKQNIETLILGCTHYSALKDIIRQQFSIPVISQDEIIPLKITDYLTRHPESQNLIGQGATNHFLVTDLTPNYSDKASVFYGRKIELNKAILV